MVLNFLNPGIQPLLADCGEAIQCQSHLSQLQGNKQLPVWIWDRRQVLTGSELVCFNSSIDKECLDDQLT